MDPLQKPLRRIALGLLGTAALAVAAFSAQQTVVGPIRDFKVPEYYPRPNQNQLKWLWAGSNAVPQESITRLLVDHVSLQTYKENGVRDLFMQADSCLFDSAARAASSDSHIRVEALGGRMTIEGNGFSWQGTNSVITISNQVHIVLKRGTNAPAQKQ
jgi:hypothetical protein